MFLINANYQFHDLSQQNNFYFLFLENKRPNGPVSLPWILPNKFLYQTMTKGCYMPNINAVRPVIHEKKMCKGFC